MQKAEAQAHEARIEIALERIRARALAMHKSDELMEVAKVLWEQMALLGQPELEASVVHLYEKDPDYIHSWRAVSIGTDSNTQLTYGHMAIPKNSCEVVREWLTNFYSDKKEYTIEISGAKQEEWYDLLFKLAPEVINSMRDKKSIHEKRYYRFSKFSGGALLMVSKQEPSAEVTYLQGRASVVFDLAYRRFSDLQKAEAQAREAQIEAALERVRSSSLAMHKSDELKDVVKVVFENFRSLGLQNIDSVNINIFHPGSKDFDLWLAAPGQDYTTNFHLPYFDHPIVNDFFDAVGNGQTVHKGIYGYDEKNKYFEYMFENSDNKYLPEERKKLILNGPGYSVITAIAKHSSIFIHNYRGETFSEEVNSILQRFTRVFDQTYTRFLDLQRAEAQAREAKIETALEKVRSRSLAMHKSDELQEVVNTVFERLKDLDIEMDSANIAIFKEGPRDYDYWIASPFQKRTASFHMPYIDLSLTRDLVAARENGKDFSSAAYSFKEKNEWFDYAFKNTDFKFLTEERKQFILAAPAITVAIAFSKHTGVQVNRYSDKLLSEGEAEILKRFSKVFEQAYIRFLDLEKAEAQARDAQIETALERVRARTMGMHQSKELHDVIETVTNQLLALGLKFDNSVFCRVNEDESWEMWMSTPQQSYPFNIYVPYIDHRIFNNLKEVKAKKFEFYTDVFDRDEAQVFFKHFFENTNAKNVPEERKQYVLSSNGMARSLFLTKDIWFVISRYSPDPFSDEENGILKRFAKVFEQSYIRFLDLEKAEAQAREAQIEASLERVRSKTMAMHNSQDVGQTVATMFDELVKLGIETMRCGIGIMLDEYQMELWTAKPDDTGKVELIIGHLDMKLHPLLTGGYDSWKDKKDGFSYELKDDDLIAYFNVINNYSGYAANYDAASLPSQIFHEEFHFNEGTLFAFSLKRLSAESSQIFKRFSGVFGQTYRRYLDLQKAEANAREAQIEASLERVRSKAMAMHNSADLSSTVNSFFKELKNLGITPMRCGVGEMHDETKTSDLVFTSADKQGELYELPGKLKHEGHPVVENIYEHWKKQEEYHPILQGADISAYYKVIKSQMQLPDFPEYAKHYGNYFYFREGFFFAWGDEQFTEEGLNICRRFTSVLSLTYKRYKDLKQAEANAREAQIEAGLERVRARTMAMHSSDDVSAATATMFTELERLGIESFRGGILNIRPDQTMDVWSVNNLAEGKVVKAAGEFDMTMHPFWQQLYTGWVNKHEVLYFNMSGKVKEDYIRILDARRDYLPGGMQELPDSHIQSYYFGEGFVWTFTLQPHSEEDKQVMKKFASVFSLTFRRYQDLKKAEAQAREATIEAALEKVRGKAMAMHNSNDLTATASQVFTELRKLGISPLRCGVGILNKENRKALLYSAVASEEGDNLSQFGWVLLDENPVLKSIYDHWIGSEDYFPVLTKEMLKAYYTHLKVGFEVPDEHKEYEQYGYFIAFSEGMFYGWAERPFTASEIKILKRFASVIDLTFRRYMELQKSEANAREAVKQAALDRVRAEIASMRTVNDLERITPLIWNELTILGIPFIRCGVFIMDEAQQLIHTFLSTPDGKAIAAFHLPYDTPGNLRNVISNWKQKQRYIDHWDETAFIQFADILVKQGALNSAELYLKTIPRGGFHLHFLPFLQGMLYVGNTTQLHDDEIVLIQHVADAFSTAYARYEDFNKLEAAKEQVEKTLTDLKQAQTQLVQSEKMASLGELTAGIAHEIQNPLNFVNNFSDVSNELLEEMKTELEKGNADDAMAIVEDIKQNLEKILHHGKRADAIVKGMLQHSRISSGQKEPTDINMLADEYLRLAFHGLRAKDKSFNAKFETEFDNSIGKINIIPQDIGRVILNLINNAFYAVTEKKKTPQLPKGGAPYEPVVTVTTKKDNGKIEITVKDNGNGIPQKVLDKIFQPFFTTKPTGQGTGLGLSLSYDIITKGHGGELKVETKEGEGSEFVIQLPTN
ncbi:MAG TPA: ATP-binding protein [Chitinophagaceae bacterium]|nr:ATP-binding protein [Chitinophagaceae bacterium]